MDEAIDLELLSVERESIVDESGPTADDVPFESYGHRDIGVCYIGDIEYTRA
jgi:hypothetical protein